MLGFALTVAIQVAAGAAHAVTISPCEFARGELLRALADREGTISATLASGNCDVAVPTGTVQLSSRSIPKRVRPRMVVWVDVTVDGRLRRSVPVAFDVRWLQEALVARSAMAARTSLNEDQFVVEKVDAAAARGEPITVEQLQSKRLRHELPAGAVLGGDDIEAIPDVTAGERVDVYSSVGSVVVRTVAVAQRDGFRGDRINVRLEQAQQSLRVEVIGKDRAKVIDNAKNL